MGVTFTDQQLRLIETPGSMFVPACPGAGKTESIVERFIRRPGGHARRGIALISFTRVAADEAIARTAHRPELRESPNFIGTIDAFINRYIVGPIISTTTGRRPTFRDTWANVPGTTISVTGRNFPPFDFELDWLEFDYDGAARMIPSRLSRAQNIAFNALPEWARKSAIERTQQRWYGLVGRGFVDCSRARAILQNEFRKGSSHGEKIVELLASRFYEVVVDEVQDCNETDVLVLQVLRNAGVKVVAVGDLEQAIYDFREALPEKLQPFLASLGNPQPLTGNFRSSPAICSLVNSLRSYEQIDQAIGQHRFCRLPVYLMLEPDLSQVHSRVQDLLDANQVPLQNFTYLSHARWAARKCARLPSAIRPSKNRLVLLAQASIDFKSSNLRLRRRGLDRYAYVLRTMTIPEFTDLADNDFYIATTITERQMHVGYAVLAASWDPLSMTPAQFADETRKGLRRLGWDSWMDPRKLRSPADWPVEVAGEDGSAAWSTIHGFKGRQAEAVGLVLTNPPRTHTGPTGIDLWRSGTAGELRRVIYVGASRAERLLILVTDNVYNYQAVLETMRLDHLPLVAL